MPNALVSPTNTHLLEWVGLLLTPGLGPVKARKLAEHFGSPEAVFAASLTLLEETGIQAVSAQSIATVSPTRARDKRRVSLAQQFYQLLQICQWQHFCL